MEKKTKKNSTYTKNEQNIRFQKLENKKKKIIATTSNVDVAMIKKIKVVF
jgi:hypothetical protein